MGEGWDFTDTLAGTDFPITVIIGDHDIVGFGGNVEFVLLENAGHNAWIDAPKRHTGHPAAGAGEVRVSSARGTKGAARGHQKRSER